MVNNWFQLAIGVLEAGALVAAMVRGNWWDAVLFTTFVASSMIFALKPPA